MSTKPSKPTPKKRRPLHATPKPRTVKKPADASAVRPDAVVLERTKGSPGRGGSPGGEAWTIFAEGKRAGVVFINWIDERPLGKHASIQIFLNATSQGRKIGRVGYRKAVEASVYDTVYAHMRKSNVASRRAAEEAGFTDATKRIDPQTVMVWHRPGY